jgi:hypothetical protein
MAKISELPLLTNPSTTTRLLALDVSAFPYSSKTVTIDDLRNKIISLGVIDVGPTLVKNVNGSFDVKVAIPSQTGNDGRFLTTNGVSVSWATLNSTFPSQTNNNGNYLTTNGTSVSWGSITKIPEQVNHAGQYLTTNGTTASWVAIGTSLLPPLTGNSGKLLTTNGSTSSWITVTSQTTTTGSAGSFLTTNGTTASWIAIGASLLATQTSNTGSYLTTNGTTSSWVRIGASLLPSHTGNTGSFLITNGSTSSWTKLTLSSLTNVVLSSPTTGQVLGYNGTNWVNTITASAPIGVTSISAGTGTAVSASTGSITIWSTVSAGAGGLLSRATFSTSTVTLDPLQSTRTTIENAYKGYALLSIQVSTGSWVTVYSNASSQTSDFSRTITTDPSPGSGVIAESISTVSTTTYFTPAILGYNNETIPTTSIPIKVYNNSSNTNVITVTATLIKLEV